MQCSVRSLQRRADGGPVRDRRARLCGWQARDRPDRARRGVGTLIVALLIGQTGCQRHLEELKEVAFALFIFAMGYSGGRSSSPT